jgi:hypothetical protein
MDRVHLIKNKFNGWCNAITGVSVNSNRQNICWGIDLPVK